MKGVLAISGFDEAFVFQVCPDPTTRHTAQQARKPVASPVGLHRWAPLWNLEPRWWLCRSGLPAGSDTDVRSVTQ